MPGKAKSATAADPRPLLANYVRAWRKHRRLTLGQLAERADLSITTVSEVERGVGDFTGKTLRALAQALETSPAALVGSPPNGGDIWSVWEELGRQDRQPEAVAILRALRDTQKK
jgi:transcriptional regulator with XRE-family HTH domain